MSNSEIQNNIDQNKEEKRYWVGDTTFPENGKMVYLLSDMKPITGIVYAVYENGSPWFELGYKNGKQHGLLKSWYDDGQVLSETYFKDGKEHGLRRFWYRNGELDYENNFENGELIEC